MLNSLMMVAAVAAQSPAADVPPAEPIAPPVQVIILPPIQRPIPFIDLDPPPTELSPAIRALAAAAHQRDDVATLKSIFRLARETSPQALAQIEALEDQYDHERAEKLAEAERQRIAQLTAASLLDNWKGEVELGGSRSTGNTESVALFGSVRFTREGLAWTHSVGGRIDFQQSDDRTVADRLRIDWQPGYKMRDGLFLYGLGQYERDRFLGFAHRFTLSTGFGFTVLSRPDMRLDLLGGPALRHTIFTDDYSDEGSKTAAVGRASLAFRWQITPTLKFAQNAAVYFEEDRNNMLSTSALETQLIGNLKARLSYDLQYEKNDLIGRKPLDTTSRATLVYSF